MEVKSKRISLSKVDAYVEIQESFGWEVVDKEDLRANNTILLTMQRDGETFIDYRGVRALEKQYHHLHKAFPLALLVSLIIACSLLGAYLALKPTFLYAISFLYGSLTFFGVSTFAFIVYILLIIKRKKLLELILKQASIKAGTNKNWPTKRNIDPENEKTWTLSKYTNSL